MKLAAVSTIDFNRLLSKYRKYKNILKSNWKYNYNFITPYQLIHEREKLALNCHALSTEDPMAQGIEQAAK